MSAQKASADADASNTHTQPEPAHTQTNWRAYMNVCVCVYNRHSRSAPLRYYCCCCCRRCHVSVRLCLWILVSTLVSNNNSSSSPTPVLGFEFMALAQRLAEILSNTHTHTCMLASILTHSHTHRHRALTCCTLHVLSLACCSWMLLPLPFVVAIAYVLLCALFRCNSLKFG